MGLFYGRYIIETHKRTILKSITWRLVATAVTAYWTGLSGAIIINIWMTAAYYFHERVWLKIKWGRSSE